LKVGAASKLALFSTPEPDLRIVPCRQGRGGRRERECDVAAALELEYDLAQAIGANGHRGIGSEELVCLWWLIQDVFVIGADTNSPADHFESTVDGDRVAGSTAELEGVISVGQGSARGVDGESDRLGDCVRCGFIRHRDTRIETSGGSGSS
jgi:hypothetical protein